ncbi:glycosyltransferase family 2 protein [Rufibacter sp. LB8]|uniref:glycosyltransferase family 2 protein n=1 Tax=Rufibacter sp. LB8 TaxID=2777781 RepID=UPI00178C6A95|nr:glycosyltransferase [Rufibacter sp. LB8]
MSFGISVVIPNYNGVHLFEHTLATVKEALQQVDLPTEIIIVDDFSTDGSVAFLHRHFPEITVIAKPFNSGFSATSNIGIQAATYDLVLLLNSDVQLTPSYFKHQLKYFEKPDTFGVMGRIVGWHDEQIQDGAKLPTYHGAKLKTSVNYLLKDENKMQDGLYTMYLSGANALIDKKKFLRLQGFNEIFSPFYCEDVDLSLRAWRVGFKCYYDHSSICRHQTSTSIKSAAKKKYVQTIYDRNKLFLNALHLNGTAKVLWILQLIPETLGRLFLLKWHYLTSMGMFLQAQPKIKESRKTFEKIAQAEDSCKPLKEVTDFIYTHIPGEKGVF